MNNTIHIEQKLKQSVSPTDLLKPKGKINYMTLDSSFNFFQESGVLFEVTGENFHFNFSINSESLSIERNGFKVSLTPEMFPDGKLLFFLMGWSTNKLILLSGYRENEETIEVLQEIETIPTIAPMSLKRWAKEQSLIQTSIYKSVDNLRDAVYQTIADLKDKIEDTGSGESFWDYQYKGNAVTKKTPKKEPLAQLLFKPMLVTDLFFRGLEIFRENKTSSGDIDFTITGAVEGIGSVSMCIELKNAHSKELENGLLNQLPDYMRSQQSEYGAYCVLNYNIDGNIEQRAELVQKLNLVQYGSTDPIVKTKIRFFVIDLDKNIVHQKRK